MTCMTCNMLVSRFLRTSTTFHRHFSHSRSLLQALGLHKYRYNMNIAYFRQKTDDDQLVISFRYKNPEFGIDRDFNFCRNIEEGVATGLGRIRSNIEKEFGKKSKKRQKKKSKTDQEAELDEVESAPPEITVQLLQGNQQITNITFRELLSKKGSLDDVVLEILGDSFRIGFNTPWVDVITLPTSILAGFFIYPSKLQLFFADKENSKFIWFRGLMPKSNKVDEIQWEQVSDGPTYNTRQDDIGYRIKVECTPGNGEIFGPLVEYISKCSVEAGPGICPFENRHIFTTERLTDDSFRTVSYNLLADTYADSDYTRKELFPYCPVYALNIDYRKQLFIKEIIGYNADIICLQEVDKKVFDLDLEPILSTRHYQGCYKRKGSTVEGIATFFDRDRFELLQTNGINIGTNIPANPVFEELYKKIRTNKKLVKRIVDRSTAVQVNVLRSKDTGNILIVANTHLYFHPDADHIRLLQVGFAMLYVADIFEKTKLKLNTDESNVSILFCGDFNSVPECGIFKLMTEKFVERDCIDWSSNQEEAVKGVTLSQPFNIRSACGTPKYTNFTVGFAACLDYIFYQTDNLDVREVIPFPSDEELSAHTAIPSVVFPSDHVALVADLKWKQKR